VPRSHFAADFAMGNGSQNLDQEIWVRAPEAERFEKCRFAAAIGMRDVQQVVDDLGRTRDSLSAWCLRSVCGIEIEIEPLPPGSAGIGE
jgi:hypothetical protein